MPKTINTHVYTNRGFSENSSSYGATVSSLTAEARMQSLETRQNGESGVRTSRSVVFETPDAEGVKHNVTVAISFFLPGALPSSALDVPFTELLEWAKETGFLTGVKNRAIE